MNRLLQHYLIDQAQRRPHAAALVFQDETLSYRELDRLSNQVARMLHAQGCQRGDRVALALPKSIPAIAGMLGVLKADAVYVPIDTSSPAARAATILEQCDCEIILAARPTDKILGGLSAQLKVGWLDAEAPKAFNGELAFTMADVEQMSDEPLDFENTSEDAAHILFTSGSTGVPMGVVIKHGNVIPYVDWVVEYFDMQEGDRNSGHPPLHFDLSTQDIYSTLASGGELHLLPPMLSLLPHKLAEYVREAKLHQWFSVPSVLNHMAKYDVIEPNDFPEMKRLLWCGEKFPTPSLMHWMEKLPHVSFTNLYGPTEATIASSFYRMPARPTDPKAETSIGTACPGERLYVLDDKLNPLPVGAVGALYISGVGLSPGYWKDQAKTDGVFLPNPFEDDPSERMYNTGDLARMGDDGLVYLLGRADTQIKVRGHRIELGEIEAALSDLDDLKDSAVVGVPVGGFETTAICCAFVSPHNGDLKIPDIKRQLAQILPNYMLPTRWKGLDRLPLNGSGKIHRKQLREEFAAEIQTSTAA